LIVFPPKSPSRRIQPPNRTFTAVVDGKTADKFYRQKTPEKRRFRRLNFPMLAVFRTFSMPVAVYVTADFTTQRQ